MTDPTTALREVLALSNKERETEENLEYGAANDLYADLQGAAVNLVRTHGPALLSALEDAERYRWLRDCDDGNIAAFYIDAAGAPDPASMLAGSQLDDDIDAAREAHNG